MEKTARARCKPKIRAILKTRAERGKKHTKAVGRMHKEQVTILDQGVDANPLCAWSHEDTQNLLILYKVLGAHWSRIARAFAGRAVNDVKNRFYTTLRRAATRAHLEDPNRFNAEFIKCKRNLVQFVDAAIFS